MAAANRFRAHFSFARIEMASANRFRAYFSFARIEMASASRFRAYLGKLQLLSPLLQTLMREGQKSRFD